MIVEQRVYTVIPGKVPKLLQSYESMGYPIAKQKLGKMLGYFYSEVGALNRIVHMYGYESFEQRLAKRAEIAQDPEWQAYVTKARAMITAQENTILIPAKFSPIKSLSDW